MSVDDEWDNFIDNEYNNPDSKSNNIISDDHNIPKNPPDCEDLYISTKTKVLFLNQPIDITNIFWKLPVINYGNPIDGIVKKQMKIVCNNQEEFNEYNKKIQNLKYFKENIIKQIDNPTARRIKYKDERKITVGISKKDIMNCRGKVKNAFYNCFAIIIRFKHENVFREIHVKVFNTGKLEIPGVVNIDILNNVKKLLLSYMQPFIDTSLEYVETGIETTVLINSNFNCGFYINRDNLYSLLRSEKYGIETAYDPCSYPGVKSKFYFNNEIGYNPDKQTGMLNKADRTMKMSELDDTKRYTEVSFMIFRTGSCLIVGNCTEQSLNYVFEYIKNLLHTEFRNIYAPPDLITRTEKKIKLRKKSIIMTNNYYNENII
tara:strand:- start:1890 stop:3014 length:1125 start_codon:yes stop_codon:yes gene_type:complete